MNQKRFNVEQIVAVLKQAEAGITHVELIRRVGIKPCASWLILIHQLPLTIKEVLLAVHGKRFTSF